MSTPAARRRRLTLLELSEATGISRMTLSRMTNLRGYSTSTETIDKLCNYFGCEVWDVTQYVDDQALESARPKAIAKVTLASAAGKRAVAAPASRKTSKKA